MSFFAVRYGDGDLNNQPATNEQNFLKVAHTPDSLLPNAAQLAVFLLKKVKRSFRPERY